MRFVLDTSALWHGPLMERLAKVRPLLRDLETNVSAHIPSIVWAERLRQVWDDDKRLAAVRGALEDSGAQIEPFGHMEAHRLACREPSPQAWVSHGRSFLVAAHVHGDRVAVTEGQGPAWEDVDRVAPGAAADLVGRFLD